jgi:hypothetical protein
MLARAPLPPTRVEPPLDPSALVRAAVGEALAPVQHAFRDLQRRIEDLERRPAAAPAVVSVAAAPAITPAHAAASAVAAPAPYRPPQATYPGPGVVSLAPIPITVGSIAPRPPLFDVAAIERDASVVIDGALDGRRRKVRLALTFVLILLVIFGGLFAALANSYQPHNSSRAPAGASVLCATQAGAPVARKGASIVA